MDIEQLAREYLAETDDLIRRDIIANIYRTLKPMIFKICNRFTNYAEIDDLTQESYFGILFALMDYDPNKSRFIYYVQKRIVWHLMRFLSQSQTSAMDDYIRIRKFEDNFFSKYGFLPSDMQIACHMRISEYELEKIREEVKRANTISLDELIPGTDVTIQDSIADDSSDFMDDICRDETRQIVRQAVKRLPKDEAEIISRHYFNGEEIKSIGTDEKTSRKIYSNGMRHLRSDKEIYRLAIEEGILSRGYNWHYSGESHTEWAGVKLYEISQLFN